MGFSLKNLLEEASAQLNTRDGGKTAATIRANRVQTPPAQTVSKPSNAYDKIRNFTNTVESVTPIGVARKLSPRFNKVADTYETGLTRSFAGGLEGMSGLVDLATPGTGTNRVTKYAQEVGRNTDAYVKDNNLSVPVYKAAQLAGEVSQAIAPSAVASAATQGTRFAGMGAKINSAKPLLGSPAKAVANESRLVRGANAAARYATQPKNVVNFGTNLLQNQGYRAAQGQDINAGTIAQDVAINAAFQGGGELASKVGGKAFSKVSGVAGDVLRNKNLKPQINTPKKQPTYGTNSNEAYTLGDYADAITGRKPVDNKTLNQITKTARAVAANEGLDINTGSLKDRDLRIADYLEARDNARIAAEKGIVPTKKDTGILDKFKSNNPFSKVKNKLDSIGQEGSIVPGEALDGIESATKKLKNKLNRMGVAEGMSEQQAKLVNDYANMLEDMGSGNGVDINPETGARITNNVRMGDTKGKNMTKTDWFLEAKRQLDSGKADKYAQADYDKLLKDANDPEVQALLNRQPEIMPDTPEAQNALAAEKLVFEAKQAAQKTEALKKQGKITPKDNNYWSTPIKGQPKAPLPDVKDINGLTPQEGDTIRFSAVLPDADGAVKQGTAKVRWSEPQIANASGKVEQGKWLGNGELDNGIPFEIVDRSPNQAKPNTIDMNDIPVDQPAFTLKESKGGDKMKVRVNKDTKKLESFIEPNDRLAQLDAMGSKAPDAELPPVSQDQINTVLERGSLKDKAVKKQLDDLTNEYLGGRKAVDINRQRTIADLEKRYQLSDAEKLNAIEVIDGSSGTAPMNQKVADYAAQFKNITDSAYADYAGKGVKMGYQNEYLPRIYQDPKTGRQLTAQEYNLLTTGSKRQKGRTSDSLYTEHLVSQDPNELLSKYYNSLDNAVAGRQYLDGLEKNGLVITSTTPVAGMRPIVGEGLQPSNGGVYYARKEVADKLNTMFGDKSPSGALEKALDKGAKINNLWQTIKLSGGVPGTPINSFGIMQSVKEAMAGNPINAGKGFLAGTSKKYAEKLFTQRADIVQRMAENGVDPRINYRKTFKSIGDKIAAETGMKGKTAAAWHAAVDDPTFGRMMPAFQLLHYDTVFNKYVGKMGEKEAGRLAAESTRNFYGMNTMAKDAFRSNATKDALGAALFAPRFREGMVNFWLKNAKALGHPTDPAYRSNMKFLVSAAATYAAMDAINYQLNGEHLYQNPDGKKDKLLVPGGVIPGSPEDKTIGIPYLSSIATVPRNVATTVGSALTGNTKEVGKGITSFAAGPIQTGGQILNNENYFGRQIYDEQASAPEKFGSIASYTLQNTNQPWVAEALNAGANKLPDNVKKFVGAKDKSAFETIANATESPLRFYDPNYMKYGGVGLTKDQREAAATVSNPSEYRKEAIAVNAAEKKQKKSDEKEIDKIKNGGKSDSTSDKVQKAKFEAGDEKEKVIGDTYYYKTKSGTVKSKPKAEYEYDKATSGVKLEMDRAKANDDVNKWFEQADKEYNALEAKKKSYDETTEKDQIDKITLQQENLLDEAKKYKTYGGFKKPKKGKGGKGGKKAKKFDYSLTGFTKKSASDKTLRALLKKATSKA